MTTIAYSHKERKIATDSQSTLRGVIIDSKIDKCKFRGDKSFFITGSCCDNEMLIDYAVGDGGKHKGLIPECAALMLDTDGKVWLCSVNNDAVVELDHIEHDIAIGSGEQFALAAMDFGKSASEAVAYAITRDIYSGGEVATYDIPLTNAANGR